MLLGSKKTGLGKGNYLGIGGKIEAGEIEVEAVNREVREEISVVDLTLNKVGEMTFLFPEKPVWNQQVHVYLCPQWIGEPRETNEIRPEWFDKNNLPLAKMWDDAQFWRPAVMNHHKLQGVFVFNPELKVTKSEMIEKKFK